ncbi:metallopeptidase family protein [Actinomyces sp. zg-332]|uniref:metallopeptidase family protein n=1 Tax=Actinomyces sp. zg-332 TaxID=2708340 RepID=UPI001422D6BE|nr:metallopeptidase family protein [Actinomyces sp. zg-332]QPK93792.1 metallopeptidase family protein [Actinomyces sp. zg-332]
MQNIFRYEDNFLPNTITKKYKDKHGRGLRGLLISPNVPAYNSKQELFESLIILTSLKAQQKWPQTANIEFCTQNVPPSDPAPWETKDAILGRTFDQDLKHNLPARIVLYRLPIQSRAKTRKELKTLIEDIICQQLAYILNIEPEEVL